MDTMYSVYSKKLGATAGVSKKSGSVVFQNKGTVRIRLEGPHDANAFLDLLIALGYDLNDLDVVPVTDEWVLENLI